MKLIFMPESYTKEIGQTRNNIQQNNHKVVADD